MNSEFMKRISAISIDVLHNGLWPMKDLYFKPRRRVPGGTAERSDAIKIDTIDGVEFFEE